MIEVENPASKGSSGVEKMIPGQDHAQTNTNEFAARIRSRVRVSVDKLHAVGILMGVMLIAAEPINRLKHRFSNLL
jgi:hypothetical protein